MAELTDEQIEAVWQRYDEGIGTRRELAMRILALSTQPPAQGAEPVAEVCPGFDIRWVGSEPIAFIIARHRIKVGAKLYTAPPPTTEVEKDARQWADRVLEKARHAMANAKGLRKFEGMEAEARARELAASYLLETAESLLLDHRLAALQSEAQAGKGDGHDQ